MATSNNVTSGSVYPGPSLPTPDHIRLVSLQPGSDNTITCELITSEIRSTLPYEALSYTWGDPKDCQVIQIKTPGSDQSQGFLVTSNCVSALRRLRYKDRQRILWIDALGINQSNLVERNHQVTLMSEIYSRATNVVIYLGEATENSDVAIDFIAECDSPASDTTSLSYPKSAPLIQALNDFFHRPWFTRVWVIQEVVLSSTGIAYCGDKTLPWSAIKHFSSWNTTNKWLAQLPFVVSASINSLTQHNKKATMLKTLVRSRHCGATDPRDKIYSMLSLLGSSDKQLGLTPRYEDSVAKVYTDYALALVTDSGYEIFSAVQGSSTVNGLPSWVPDWSVQPKREVLGTLLRITMSHFWDSEKPTEASNIAQPLVDKITFLNAEKASVGIRLAGYLCGSVTRIGSTFLAGQGIFPLKEWRALSSDSAVASIDRTSDVPLHHGAHGPNDYVFHKVISAAGFAYASAIGAFVKTEREYDENGKMEGYESDWLDHSKAKVSWETRVHRMAQKNSGRLPSGVPTLPFADIPFHLAAKNQPYSYEKYVQFVLRHCHSRRFFITDTGYMGIGPEEVEVGDQIYLCVGATIPFAFREVKGNHSNMDSKLFQLVGECYTEERAWKDLKSKPESPPYFIVI